MLCVESRRQEVTQEVHCGHHTCLQDIEAEPVASLETTCCVYNLSFLKERSSVQHQKAWYIFPKLSGVVLSGSTESERPLTCCKFSGPLPLLYLHMGSIRVCCGVKMLSVLESWFNVRAN